MDDKTQIEVWKDIAGFEGIYQVSNFGNVKSFHKNSTKIKKTLRNSNTYNHLSLYDNGNIKYTSVHRVVAETFIPNPNRKPFVNHINGDKKDNRVINLEWCTNSENIIHARDMGVLNTSKGDKHYLARLSEKDIPLIRYMLKIGMYQKSIAKLYGVNRVTITDIKMGRTWSHVN